MTNGRGNLLRHVEAIGREVDVVGDEGHPCTDHRRAGGRMRRGRAEIGRPPGGGHLRREPLELAAPDVFQVFPQRIARGFFVQVDRHMEPFGNRRADTLRQRNAIGHRDALDWHEGDDVHGSHAGMLATMRAQIDVRDGALEQREHRLLDSIRGAREREHRPVVRCVRRHIEELDTTGRTDDVRHPGDHIVAAAFAHIRDTLDQSHEIVDFRFQISDWIVDWDWISWIAVQGCHG